MIDEEEGGGGGGGATPNAGADPKLGFEKENAGGWTKVDDEMLVDD